MGKKADSLDDRKKEERGGGPHLPTEEARIGGRRRHVRLPLTVPVRFQLPDHPDRSFAGRTQNLSDSGLMLVAGDPLPPDSTVSLALLFRDTEVPLEGEVVWSRRLDHSVAQTGIQFRFPPDQGFATQLFMRQFLGHR